MEKLSAVEFNIGDWQVLPAKGALLRAGKMVHLEPKVMEVLVYFASRPGEVISREELEREVWRGALVGYDAVTATVIKLRKALQDSAKQPSFIATIPKRGYQLIAPVCYPDSDDHNARINDRVSESLNAPLKRGRSRAMLHIGLLIVVFGSLFVLSLVWPWWSVSPLVVEPAAKIPSVLIMPFENLSEDASYDNFVDGITEDIVTDLSRLSNLLVMARNTSFRFKNRSITPQEVRKELKVDYVLKGNIRRLENTILINVQLADTETGFNKWAEHYESNVKTVFGVQGNVTSGITNALAINITKQEKQRLSHITIKNMQAYDFFQEGQRISRISTKETSELAREKFRKAIDIDPTYGRAYGAMAYSLAFSFRRGWTDSPVETLDRALMLAQQALALDDSIPQTYWALGYVYLMRKELEKANKVAVQAINIAPNYADGYGLLSLISNNLGHAKQAIEYVTRGMQLNPYYTWDYPYNLGCAYYMLGDYDAAIEALEKAQERNENAIPIKLYLAASYVEAGRSDDAEWITEQLLMLNPALTLSHTEKTIPIVDSKIKRTLLNNLRHAGIPE